MESRVVLHATARPILDMGSVLHCPNSNGSVCASMFCVCVFAHAEIIKILCEASNDCTFRVKKHHTIT